MTSNITSNMTSNTLNILASPNQDFTSNLNETEKLAENAMSEEQPKAEVVLTTLPNDLLNRILSQLSIHEIARSRLACKKFATLTQDPILWRNIATLKNVPLEGNETTNQIIGKLFAIKEAVISLKNFSGECLAGLSQNRIEERSGICLTLDKYKPVTNQLSGENDDYEGIVVLKEKTPQGDKWFLHLCPGGGNEFTNKDFERLMPIAIKKLEELKIKPDYLSSEIGRHAGNTFQCFQKWQASQK